MANSATAIVSPPLSFSSASPSSSSSSSSSLSCSPTVRFLGHLKIPEQPSDLNNGVLEFQESDIVWSSSSDRSTNPSPSHVSTSPQLRHHQRKSGLHAALSDDQHPLVRRKPAMSPSLSATTAARTIPPVAPMRSSENFTGSCKYNQSAPVNVPIWPKKLNSNLGHFDEVVDDVAKDGEMIPPHEIVARSHVTFSVFEGAGRTLKGWDLRRVRNAVFQQTGFLD